MSVTGKLLKVFEIDLQLRGLRSRLTSAERFLSEQDKELANLSSKKDSLDKQSKQLLADAHNAEVESQAVEAKMASIREKMDNAQSNKEYKAFLTELNTRKLTKEQHDEVVREKRAHVDTLKHQLSELETKVAERHQVRKVAVSDRDARNAEIADRVAELSKQRDELAREVPGEVLSVYARMLEQRGEAAMGKVEEVDRKRHEYSCGSCMMHLPVDRYVTLKVKGDLTRCSSCQCILFIDEAGEAEAAEAAKAAKAEKKASKPRSTTSASQTKGLAKDVAKDVARDLAPKKKIEKPATAPLAKKKGEAVASEA